MIETLSDVPAAGPSLGSRIVGLGATALRPIAVVAVALLLGVVLIIYTGQNPLPAYENLLIEPFRSWETLSSVFFYAIPLVLTGLAASAAFRCNIFNIGGEGQLQIGALVTAWAALSMPTAPSVLLVPLALVAGAVAGALWASIAGWLRAFLGATELVSTIMLNYVAIDFATYAVSVGGPIHTRSGAAAASDMIPAAAQFPTIGNSQFHWGFVVALLAVAAIFVLLYRTGLGYEIRMVGANPFFAQYGGVGVRRVIMVTMGISGALAGLAGAVQVMGGQYQYTTSFITSQWGFTGVTVALLARLEPLGVVVAALLYAVLEEGGQLMENNTNVDHNIITVVQGLIILLVTVQIVIRWRGRRLAAKGTAG